ncbi:endo-1,4-beta-xylanase [Rhizobium tumorigenes]|uniref:Beta-xylanase n=1 Tax=Rhizobium tumorigenes TaxID=2041385 RepID=A0AAF1K8P5_9HYPH|nr:endo-1,4-beta-xylanase [Rhizobium tumorigenes]WFR97739.1 endo-1,4-beta-xylanase [Rhizobium tumorigenes]
MSNTKKTVVGKKLKRRTFLAAAGASLVSNRLLASDKPLAAPRDGLRTLAAKKNLLYGCAVSSINLAKDKSLAAATAAEAGILVPEFEMKRKYIETVPGAYTFEAIDEIVAFAETNNQDVRGHPLVWHSENPTWLAAGLETASSLPKREALLVDYISNVIGRYAGRFHSWDVVNEAIEPRDGEKNGLRKNSIWYQNFGEDYIALSFHAAKAADPHALLVLNDYGVEAAPIWHSNRRTAVLSLLERMKTKNVPIECLGIQGHLWPYADRFDERVFSNFLDDVSALGLKIMITEMDVSDKAGPSDVSQRDAFVAHATKPFLDVALSKNATIGALTWGLSDRYSWHSVYEKYRRTDGQISRVLPLDADMKRKPMWQSIASSFEEAEPRSPI